MIAGVRATAMLVTSLPTLTITLTDAGPGRRMRVHFKHRIWGIPHSRLVQGVLVIPSEEGLYLRGRSRQAVRTNIRKARAAGICCRRLDSVQERRTATEHLRARVPWTRDWDDARFCEPGDVWWAAFEGERAVAIAQMTVDGEWALLQMFSSSERTSRYLLHTELVEFLVREKVGYLAVNGPTAPLLDPNLQYWQRLLGYKIFNLSLARKRLDAPAVLDEREPFRPPDRIAVA